MIRDITPSDPSGRIRHRVETDMVAHLWANQSQAYATNGRNFHFNGNRLISYSTTIGRIVENESGQRAALLTTRKYSVTTSGQMSTARSACRHLPTFYVLDPCGSEKSILENWGERITQSRELAGTKRTAVARAKAYEEHRAIVASANRFCEFFGLPLFPVPEPLEQVQAILAEERRKQAERDAKAAETRKQEAAKRLAEAHEALSDWLAGRSDDTWKLRSLDGQYMRLSADGTEIETTLGARVPADHVRRISPLVLSILAKGESFRPNGRTIRIGHFNLDRIDSDGTVMVGCHRFARAEIERFAAVLDASPVSIDSETEMSIHS